MPHMPNLDTAMTIEELDAALQSLGGSLSSHSVPPSE